MLICLFISSRWVNERSEVVNGMFSQLSHAVDERRVN